MWCMGLAGGYYHDAAACLFNDERLVLCIEEERLTRVRYASDSYPKLCILVCLEEAGIRLKDIDVIALSWNPLFPNEAEEIQRHEPIVSELFPPELFGPLRARILVVDHQLAHASSAFRTSNEETALVISVDGAGDGKSVGIYRGDHNGLTTLEVRDITQSLGWFYQRVTTYVGLGSWQHGGKTMAIAAYGEPKYQFDFFELDEGKDYKFTHPHGISNDNLFTLPHEVHFAYYKRHREFLYEYFRKLGIPRGILSIRSERLSGLRIYTEPTKEVIDLAASAQKVIEDALVAIVSRHLAEQQLSSLCMAGGVAMNCKAIGELLRRIPGLMRVHVPPGSGDMGGALGAALEVLARFGICQNFPLVHSYWGLGYDDDEIVSFLAKVGLKAEVIADPAHCAADMVAKGSVIGWFQGRMEFGARALGNRSILARPDDCLLRDRINTTIKNREIWRPFSPSVISSPLLSQGWQYSSQASPFMTVALLGTDRSANLGGVRHIDGTSRVQVITDEANPRFAALIKGVESKLGYPAVLNTSLNARDEPIACRPSDALRVFASTPLDALFLGRSLLRK